MKPITAPMLHPLTLAFDQGLREGHVTLGDALEFCNRCFDAYLEAVERNPRSTEAFALKGIVVPRNKEPRHSG